MNTQKHFKLKLYVQIKQKTFIKLPSRILKLFLTGPTDEGRFFVHSPTFQRQLKKFSILV